MLKKFFIIAIIAFFMFFLLGVMGFLVYLFTNQESDVEANNEVIDEITDETVGAAEGVEGPFGKNEYWVTNSTSGEKLHVQVMAPPRSDSLWTLVLVPGGRGAGNSFLNSKTSVQDLVDEGFTVVLFDPEGRGLSEGEEDDNGTIGQDGLKAVVDFASAYGDEGARDIGLVSFSYGITMASGMLARYPDASVAFLIDWEGPSDRTETGACGPDSTGHLQDVASCDDEEFWSQREAATFIEQINVPYQRLQTETDHVQSDYAHTVKMINGALESSSPWVRLNDDLPNTRYTQATVLGLPDIVDRILMAKIAEYANYVIANVLE